MKKKTLKRGAGVLFLLCLLCAVCGMTVFAATTEVHDGDLMVTDTGLVIVDQTVEGDLLGLASEMRVTGTVKGSIRVAANSLTLSGTVERNVTVAATELKTAKTLQADDVVIIAGLAEIDGSFESLSIYATQVVISGHIAGELICEADRVIILEGATFGSAKISSPNEPVVASDMSLKNYKTLSESGYAKGVEFTRTASDLLVSLVSLIYTLPAALLLSWVVVWVMKRSSAEAAQGIKERPIIFLMKGFGAFLALVFGSVFLIANPLTMSLGFILMLLMIVVLIACNSVAAAVLGRLWFRKKGPYVGAALVTVILSLLSVVPYASLLLWVPTTAVAFGTVCHLFFGKRSRRGGYTPEEPDFRL